MRRDFRLDRDVYKRLLAEYREGDATYMQIEEEEKGRAANVIFVGAEFENFEMKNLYKSLNLIKPDVVVMQVRPDLVLD